MAQTTSGMSGDSGANGAAGNAAPPAQTPNTVQPAPARTAQADEATPPRTLWEFAPEPSRPVQNSIRPATARRSARDGVPSERKPKAEIDVSTVPAEVRERFVQRGR